MKQRDHLPFFGIGPYYVAIIAILTALGMILSARGYLAGGIIPALKTPMLVLGILLILLGAFIWGYAFFFDRIDDAIKNNRLYTGGIYAWVRNPLYVGWMFICIGASLFAGNLWLLVLPFIFWGLMALMMSLTEEKWLRDRYGAEYEAYCKRVNRTWPWFPRKRGDRIRDSYRQSRKGWFTPPFETFWTLQARLEKGYRLDEYHKEGSIVYFKATKI